MPVQFQEPRYSTLTPDTENFFRSNGKIETSELKAIFKNNRLREKEQEQILDRQARLLKQSASLPDIVGKFSKKLLATMHQEKCEGDFCNFRVAQSYE